MRKFLVLSVFALACGAEPDESETPHVDELSAERANEDAALRERVAKILRARAYDTRDLMLLDDDQVVVEGDMVMKVDDILALERTSHDKGYVSSVNSIIATPAIIHLVNSTQKPLSAAWMWAFVSAAADWNSKLSHVVFTVNPPPLGAAKLTLSKESLSMPCATAWTEMPSAGRPAKRIIVNATLNCPDVACRGTNIEAVSVAEAVKTAAHELGHAIGLSHPAFDDIAPVHIPFTTMATALLSYPSVMWSGCTGGNLTSTVSGDDQLSAYVLGY